MIGKTISHYKIIEKLGEGGMGVVYLAKDLDLQRQVALKILPEELIQDKDNVERFRREARAAASLNHPNIVIIHEIGIADDEHFIIMEYVKGETLRDRLRRIKQPTFNEIRNIMNQLCRGLESAHLAGIVHRDIKPENILINEQEQVKILDFGLAKLRGGQKLTKDFSTLGTINYISPEQARGEESTTRSDIWSAGIILYEMISGQLPFRGEYEQALIYSILNEQPEAMKNLRPDTPAGFQGIINKALNKDPAKRYDSISDLSFEIERVLGHTAAQSHDKTGTGWLKTKYIFPAITVLVLLILAGWYFLLGPEKNIDRITEEMKPLITGGNYDAAYSLMKSAGMEVSDLKGSIIFDLVTGYLSIDTNVGEVPVMLTRIHTSPQFGLGEENEIGITPLINHMLFTGEYLIRMSIAMAETLSFIYQISSGDSVHIYRIIETGYKDMVFVNGGIDVDGQSIAAFYMDKYEVTNKNFFTFIADGGYRRPDLWPEKMVIDKKWVNRDTALNTFVDLTGIPAPRQWSGGKYPDGAENHPVTGICWYESFAYAEWAGKQLPNWQQWWWAALGGENRVYPWGNDVSTFSERANFGSNAVRPVGSKLLGVSPSGCFDMAGNVSEWLMGYTNFENPARTTGGSWQNPSYMFDPTLAQPLPRDYAGSDIGFRCVKQVKKD